MQSKEEKVPADVAIDFLWKQFVATNGHNFNKGAESKLASLVAKEKQKYIDVWIRKIFMAEHGEREPDGELTTRVTVADDKLTIVSISDAKGTHCAFSFESK